MLLAVVSCHSREEFSNAISNTWAPLVNSGTDLMYFRGRGGTREPRSNEVFLDCDDGYSGLPEKVQSIMRWAYEHGYDYCTKIDDDVVMDPKRFLEQDFLNWDFMGMGKSPDGKENDLAMPYGYCYTLSRKAMRVILDRPLPKNDTEYESRHATNDEYWVSWCLYREKIYLHVNWSCRLWDGLPSIYPELPDATVICVHMHLRMSKPEEVQEMHRIWRDNFGGA